jgi:hypothetical protein
MIAIDDRLRLVLLALFSRCFDDCKLALPARG